MSPTRTPRDIEVGQVTGHRNCNIHSFTGDITGKGQNVAPPMSNDLTPYSVFMLYFAAVIILLVEEKNRYYHQQYLDFLDNGSPPVPDIAESKMFLFLSIIIQMGHDMRDNLKDYWSNTEQFSLPFYGKTMR
jgi:hypothetical protein